MFKKVLIANRGEIACRIIKTLKKLNIVSVAVYSDEDRETKHRILADFAFHLEGSKASDTYLNIDKILKIAKENDVDAIHPGYGFLSENYEFVKKCQEANITFIGPTEEQIKIFGLKHEARDLAIKNNVPLLSGSNLLKSIEEAKEHAEKIGYPVMLKSTAGGGGIGMTICFNQNELEEHYQSVIDLSKNNFSNDGVFLEKYIQNARHIEIQIFGDGKGKVIALGERDCSLQRRNQKVIEETPSLLSDQKKQQIINSAIELCSSINYLCAGTVEYIYDLDDENFYFLEVNTRLQVEHPVTELICRIDLVEWMIKTASGDNQHLENYFHKPMGHAIEARIYAEDVQKNFQPSTGLITYCELDESLRWDDWIESGTEVSTFYDSMLAKGIAFAETREKAIKKLDTGLTQTKIYGVETNLNYVTDILKESTFLEDKHNTKFLQHFEYSSNQFEILNSGLLTTIQDLKGRLGYWNIGIPPSGAMDQYAFKVANLLVGNSENDAGLEMTAMGATLKFRQDAIVSLTGAEMQTTLDGRDVSWWQSLEVKKGQILKIGKVKQYGQRAYLAISGGIDTEYYLNSRSTFTFGKLGGHGGRALKNGDVINFFSKKNNIDPKIKNELQIPSYSDHWEIGVLIGPHSSEEFFQQSFVKEFFETDWKIHYNSDRTGIRLLGPKPKWTRKDGGEAGLHPSNIHDNPYAFGSIDFTGDMPIILGPDGPSLGGFVCLATIAKGELWKTAQMKPNDTVRFVAISTTTAKQTRNNIFQNSLTEKNSFPKLENCLLPHQSDFKIEENEPILRESQITNSIKIVYRQAGDCFILIEIGDLILDIELRFLVHIFMNQLQEKKITGVIDLTPGVRSLQIHFDPDKITREDLLNICSEIEKSTSSLKDLKVDSRTLYLPLSWDDPTTVEAIERYKSINPHAPWCPSNIEFICRINGLENEEELKKIFFQTDYLVLGLGDVYLGAPLATPIDPRHRLVTTKYNPARTWTPENAVGIGGAYLCIYGMEGPGGYQFVGRTLQIFNRYRITNLFTKDNPCLLRFFDKIRYYPVSHEELTKIRNDFLIGKFTPKVEKTVFDLGEYKNFLIKNKEQIKSFKQKQEKAFDEERARWELLPKLEINEESFVKNDEFDEMKVIKSFINGSIVKVLVKQGDKIEEGQAIMTLESMKVHINVEADKEGVVSKILYKEGEQVQIESALLVLE